MMVLPGEVNEQHLLVLTEIPRSANLNIQSFHDDKKNIFGVSIHSDLLTDRIRPGGDRMFADKGDVLVAISSSGQSENILRGVEAGKEKGCEVLTLSGFAAENPLRGRGSVNFYVSSDAYGHVEVVHHAICHCILDTIIEHHGKD